MDYGVRDILEYTIALVSDFAKKFNLTDVQAFRYIKAYNGIAFIEENYTIIHTLSFEDAIENLILFCRRKGGLL
jgi:hypothetical protein